MEGSKSGLPVDHRWLSFILYFFTAGAMALLALFVCGYRFGVYDQAQYLVQVVDHEHPGALSGDPYTQVFGSLGSLFWLLVSMISTEEDRPLISLILTLGITLTNALLLMRIGKLLLADSFSPRTRFWASVILALVFVVPKEQNWFGLVSLGDVELTATLAVMPLVFLSILLWISGRSVPSLIVGLLALPIQGQTAVYLLCAWVAAALWEGWKRPRLLAAGVAIGLSGVVSGAAAATNEGMSLPVLNEYHRIALDLYAPLINPLEAPITAWLATFLILALGMAGILTVLSGNHSDGNSDSAAARKKLVVWVGASVVFPVFTLLLLALDVKQPLLWKLMAGRSLMLPQIGALIFFTIWVLKVIKHSEGRKRWSALIALSLVVLWPVSFIHGGVASYPWLRNGEDPYWLEAQKWARENTPAGTVFLTPPYLSGWRVTSHRPTFGEIKDGGLMFYAGEPLLDWADRMHLLGMVGPFHLLETLPRNDSGEVTHLTPPLLEMRKSFTGSLGHNYRHIRKLSEVRYLVVERSADVPLGDIVWSNKAFLIRDLTKIESGDIRTADQTNNKATSPDKS